MNKSIENKRIAKNTLYLYFRTILIMLVTLYTSRVVLQSLGVVDYGIYNVVGGTIAMLSILTNALSTSISRFITFELGTGNLRRIQSIFSSSIIILLAISFFVLFLGETCGLWFINTLLNIPEDRIVAANWVWQCVILLFIINLLSVPYNSLIIAHEHMSAYATISILEAVLKLAVAVALNLTTSDKLIVYSILLVLASVLVRIVYTLYCDRKFKESRFSKNIDRALIKEMLTFTGLSFFNQTPYILNNQGINILINVFFGVTLNAARGIAHQVESAVIQLVSNFMVAVKPQITKSYAQGDTDRVFQLICNGSKYGFYLMLFFSIPILFETEYILELWLGVVPEHTTTFLRLALVAYMVSMLGETGYTACQATGNIKRYTKIVSSVALIPLPATWLAFSFGQSANYAYYTYIFTYGIVNIVRLSLMKQMIGFNPSMFYRNVVLPISIVSLFSFIIPFIIYKVVDSGFLRLLCISLASVAFTSLSIWYFGLSRSEKSFIRQLIKDKIKR